MDVEMQEVPGMAVPQDLGDAIAPEIQQQEPQAAEYEYNEEEEEEEEMIDPDEADEVDLSDADSDDFKLSQDMAKMDASVAAFKASMAASDDEDHGSGSRRPKIKRRGPHRDVEHSAEIKLALHEGSQAFMNNDLDHAYAIMHEIIRVNAETHEAWMMLSSIFQERGHMAEAISAMCFAAHLKPKDFQGWMGCATFALDDNHGNRENNLATAQLCYSAAIKANPKSIKARTGKANVALEQGRAQVAAAEYVKILKRRPFDMAVLRNLVEAAFDINGRNSTTYLEKTIGFYEQCIAHVQAGGAVLRGSFEWSDVLLFVEMWAFLDRYDNAATSLRSLSRMLIGRQEESFWDRYEDDREFDLDDQRRREAPEYDPNRYPPSLYGSGLQLDLRAKLAIYRLRLGHDEEAQRHIDVLNPENRDVLAYFHDSPFVVRDVANQLMESRKITIALRFYNLYRQLSGEPEADVLVQQGRCYLEMEDQATAEEFFIAAIELDDSNIDARYELARMYEGAQEKDEAFILVNEALQLQRDNTSKGEEQKSRRRARAKKPPKEKKPRRPKRVHVRKMAGATKRQMYENTVSENLKEKYQRAQELRAQIASGDKEAEVEWMAAAQDLVDDFRSFKDFYPWDKYLKFLGYANLFQKGEDKEENNNAENQNKEDAPQDNPHLAAMAERLQKNLAPEEMDGSGPVLRRNEHRGIPFNAWLDLFLEYAVSLARRQQAQDAYVVCQSARDSIVYKSADNMFLIHVAWAACAVYAADEETCVAVARFFMRNRHAATDSYRIFSALCRVCQSPVSWYASGPAQKYILRQIKAMDKAILPAGMSTGLDKWVLQDGPRHEALDVPLLMLYGHILLTSTSYTYALNYFLRAAAIDPFNPMVNLSTGLAYIHYSMKRQAEQRQYILAQGLHYLFRYYDVRMKSADVVERLEAHYNLGRAYNLLGLYHLAIEFYGRVLTEAKEHQLATGTDQTECLFVLEAATNLRTLSLINGDFTTASETAETWLVI